MDPSSIQWAAPPGHPSPPNVPSPSPVPAPPGEFVEFGEIRMSPTLGKLALALSKAQGAIAKKDRSGQVGQARTKYADLASVWDAVQKPLEMVELAIPQIPVSQSGERCTVYTMLVHSSGEWIGGSLTLIPTTKTPQGIGSAITYARRYALCAMVGVAPDDDDGALASATPRVVPGFGAPAPTHAIPPTIAHHLPQPTQDRMAIVGPLIGNIPMETFGSTLIHRYGTMDLAALTPQQFDDLCRRLQAR